MAKIIKYGNPILRQKSVEVPVGEDLSGLINDLKETMKEAKGVGLAAPQIGVLKRVFMVAGMGVVINPIISIAEDTPKCNMDEGCLSIPAIIESVERPQKIKIAYYDSLWNKVEEEHDGMIARVMQHEYDHLEGILFIDHLSLLKRRMLSNKLRVISKSK
jgi:peptide deformylase